MTWAMKLLLTLNCHGSRQTSAAGGRHLICNYGRNMLIDNNVSFDMNGLIDIRLSGSLVGIRKFNEDMQALDLLKCDCIMTNGVIVLMAGVMGHVWCGLVA